MPYVLLDLKADTPSSPRERGFCKTLVVADGGAGKTWSSFSCAETPTGTMLKAFNISGIAVVASTF
jgi:hypothetical protein